MIDVLLDNDPQTPAKMVIHWGTGIDLSGLSNPEKWLRGTRRGGTMKACKSYTLGLYPKNIITEEIYND